jgi:hypothetical protein
MTTEARVSVWTHSYHPEWTEKNAGISDMLLIIGITRTQADSLVDRLTLAYADEALEIRDIHNVCVWATDPSLVGQDRSARNRPPKTRR